MTNERKGKVRVVLPDEHSVEFVQQVVKVYLKSGVKPEHAQIAADTHMAGHKVKRGKNKNTVRVISSDSKI